MCTENEEKRDPPKAKNACLGDRIMGNVKRVPFKMFLISYKDTHYFQSQNTERNYFNVIT